MAEEQTSGKMNGSAAHSQLRILVVDDSSTIRRSAETMLTAEGYDVVTAENGFEALSMPGVGSWVRTSTSPSLSPRRNCSPQWRNTRLPDFQTDIKVPRTGK
jgi:hypothetical protein